METMWLVLFVVSIVALVVFVCKAVWSLIRRTKKVKRNLLFALLSFILILVSSVSYASIFAKEALSKNNTASNKKESLNSEEKMTKEEKELSKTKADQEPLVTEAKPKEEPKKEETKAKPVAKVDEKDLNTTEGAKWRAVMDNKIGIYTGKALNDLKSNLSTLTTNPEMVNSQQWKNDVRMDLIILEEVDRDIKLEVKEVPSVYKEAHNKILEGFKEFKYVTTNLPQATQDNRPVSENKLLMKCIESLNKGDAKIQEAVDIVNKLDESVNKEG